MFKSGGIAVIAIIGALLVGLPPATANNVSTGSCQVTATSSGFLVEWQPGGSEVDAISKFVVERQVFSRYWWRTAVDSSASSFSDAPAPRNAARMEYRVVGKDSNGNVVSTIPCEPGKTDGFDCVQTVVNGKDVLNWNVPAEGLAVDYVVRRKVAANGEFFWRGRTNDQRFSDVKPATGAATYLVLARKGRVIVASTVCEAGDSPVVNPTDCYSLQALATPVFASRGNLNISDWTLRAISADGSVVATNLETGVQAASSPIPGITAAEGSVFGVTPTGGVYVRTGNTGGFYWDGVAGSTPRTLPISLQFGVTMSQATGNLYDATTEGVVAYVVSTGELRFVEGPAPQSAPLSIISTESGVFFFDGAVRHTQPESVFKINEGNLELEPYTLRGLIGLSEYSFGAKETSQGSTVLFADSYYEEADGTIFIGYLEYDFATDSIGPGIYDEGAFFIGSVSYTPTGQLVYDYGDRSFSAIAVQGAGDIVVTDENDPIARVTGFTSDGLVLYKFGDPTVFDPESRTSLKLPFAGQLRGGDDNRIVAFNEGLLSEVRFIDRACLGWPN